jgi:hypothetical protein
MSQEAAFVLVHSPLVGPLTWSRVAVTLRSLGLVVVVPTLQDDPASPAPFWQQHADSVAQAVAHRPARSPLVLVGHSGAEPLLPAIATAAQSPVAAYVFIDAGLPRDGVSRLDAMEDENHDFAQELRTHLAAGGQFPEWTAEDLRAILPDDGVRRALIGEVRPRTWAFFTERLPGFAGAPAAPCGYVQLSAAYTQPAAQAQRAGWACRVFDAGHFHMLVDPVAVSRALVDLSRQVPGPQHVS